MKNSIVITYGRCNPPHKGHQLVYDKMIVIANRKNGECYFLTSTSHDSIKNPLMVNDKVEFLRKGFPAAHVDGVSGGFIAAVKSVSPGKDLTIVVGRDRVKEIERLINKYNHKEYDFDTITVIDAGTRDGDAPSASKARQAAKDGDYKLFDQLCHLRRFTDKDVERLYRLVRKGLNVE